MRKAKRFLALLTAAVMCVASAVPVMAYSIPVGDLKSEMYLPDPLYNKIISDKATGVVKTNGTGSDSWKTDYTLTYNDSGKLAKAHSVDSSDDGYDYWMFYDYNDKGQLTRYSIAMEDKHPTSPEQYIDYEYSGDQLIKDSDHKIVKWGFDTTTTYTYTDGKLTKKDSVVKGQTPHSWTETYTYNADGTLAKLVRDEIHGEGKEKINPVDTTTYTYVRDANGNLTNVKAATVYTGAGEQTKNNEEYSCTYKDGKIAAIDYKETHEPEVTGPWEVSFTFTYAANASEPTKPAEPDTSTGFSDVKDSAYYANAVKWAVEKEITKGLSATTFGPDQKCTRAQIVTFLYKQAGSPDVSDVTLPFTDVKAGAYYENAVKWAVKNNITSGLTATTFAPNATCTRAQIVTFLYKANGSEAVTSTDLPFTDVAAGAYYETPVAWAVQKNVTGGTTKTTFSPKAACTRAQAVSFLYRAASGK